MQAAITTIAPPLFSATIDVMKLTTYASASVNTSSKIMLVGKILPA
jgi:hypothetical protein